MAAECLPSLQWCSALGAWLLGFPQWSTCWPTSSLPQLVLIRCQTHEAVMLTLASLDAGSFVDGPCLAAHSDQKEKTNGQAQVKYAKTILTDGPVRILGVNWCMNAPPLLPPAPPIPPIPPLPPPPPPPSDTDPAGSLLVGFTCRDHTGTLIQVGEQCRAVNKRISEKSSHLGFVT